MIKIGIKNLEFELTKAFLSPKWDDDNKITYWKDYKEIRKSAKGFKSQETNIPKYLNFLISKGILERNKEYYYDNKNRKLGKYVYRLKQNKSVYTRLFLIYNSKLQTHMFLSSNYGKDFWHFLEKEIDELEKVLFGAGAVESVLNQDELARAIIGSGILDLYLQDNKLMKQVFKELNQTYLTGLRGHGDIRDLKLKLMLLSLNTMCFIHGYEGTGSYHKKSITTVLNSIVKRQKDHEKTMIEFAQMHIKKASGGKKNEKEK